MTVNKDKMTEDPHPGAGTLYVHGDSVTPAPVTWEEILKVSHDCRAAFDLMTTLIRLESEGG